MGLRMSSERGTGEKLAEQVQKSIPGWGLARRGMGHCTGDDQSECGGGGGWGWDEPCSTSG